MKHLKSVFERIAEDVFKATNLSKIKEDTINFINETQIKDVDKQTIITNINACKTLNRLQQYICNSLLKYEGLSVK